MPSKDLTDLVFGVVLHQEHVDDGDLVDESVTLKLLSHARADDRDGEGDRVHGLDLRRLERPRGGPSSAIALPWEMAPPSRFALNWNGGNAQLGPILGTPPGLVASRRPNWPLFARTHS